MERESTIRPGEYEFIARTQISGLISAARVDAWIQWFWHATGDTQLLRELLEWEIQDNPEIRRVLERVLEIENKLVTHSTVAQADRLSWVKHLELLRRMRWSEVWLFCGVQGSGKTSTALGVIAVLKSLGWTVTTDPKIRADILYWDDLGKWFHKHKWQTKVGQEIGRFLQVVREQYTLVLGTSPREDELHISIRESELAETINVISNGLAYWRDPIKVVPIMPKDESWRFEYGKKLSKIMAEVGD